MRRAHNLKVDRDTLVCRTCGGRNGGMPTSCPGHQMEPDVAVECASGGMDFFPGKGWVWCKTRLEYNRARNELQIMGL